MKVASGIQQHTPLHVPITTCIVSVLLPLFLCVFFLYSLSIGKETTVTGGSALMHHGFVLCLLVPHASADWGNPVYGHS